MKRFELAGKRKDNEPVFLMSLHRTYKANQTIFHHNNYHTVVHIPNNVFKEHFKYNHSSGIYVNLTGMVWAELRRVADIKTIDLTKQEATK